MTDQLTALRDELRLELADSRWFRLHTRVVPSSPERIQLSRWDAEAGKWQPNWDETIEVLDAGEAPSLSRSAEAYLDGLGVDALPQRSITEIGIRCHAEHYAHCEADGCPPEGLPARTPLCERVMVAYVELTQPIGHIAWREDRPEAEIESIAMQALTRARSWKHRRLHAYMRNATENERDSRVVCPLCIGRRVVMRRRPAA